jgi:peptide/nickel transport system permease protein
VTGFLARKVGGALVTFVLALTFAFLLSRLSGDPTVNILGPFAQPEQFDELRARLGLDEPLPVQFLDYLTSALTADFGASLQYGQENTSLILERLPNTLILLAVAMTLAIAIGVPLGVLAAVKEGSAWDWLASTTALVGQSVPVFWLGLMLILIFAVNLGLLPAGQDGGPDHVVLPAVTLALFPLAQIARLTRATMAEVLREPYIDAARARGLAARRIIGLHALRNASLPVVTIAALQAGMLLSGAVAVEYIYNYSGFGLLAIQAVEFRDFTLVQAVVVFGVLAFVLLNLLVDVLYAVIDPRIRRV